MPIQCDLCGDADAVVHCKECNMNLCALNGCNNDLHNDKLSSRHTRTAIIQESTSSTIDSNVAQSDTSSQTTPPASVAKVNLPLCEICEAAPGELDCKACDMCLCAGCDEDMHKGGLKKHVRTKSADRIQQQQLLLQQQQEQQQQQQQQELLARQQQEEEDKSKIAQQVEVEQQVVVVIPLISCDVCSENGVVSCGECELNMCDTCDHDIHQEASMKRHKRTPITQQQSLSKSTPNTETNDNMNPGSAITTPTTSTTFTNTTTTTQPSVGGLPPSPSVMTISDADSHDIGLPVESTPPPTTTTPTTIPTTPVIATAMMTTTPMTPVLPVPTSISDLAMITEQQQQLLLQQQQLLFPSSFNSPYLPQSVIPPVPSIPSISSISSISSLITMLSQQMQMPQPHQQQQQQQVDPAAVSSTAAAVTTAPPSWSLLLTSLGPMFVPVPMGSQPPHADTNISINTNTHTNVPATEDKDTSVADADNDTVKLTNNASITDVDERNNRDATKQLDSRDSNGSPRTESKTTSSTPTPSITTTTSQSKSNNTHMDVQPERGLDPRRTNDHVRRSKSNNMSMRLPSALSTRLDVIQEAVEEDDGVNSSNNDDNNTDSNNNSRRNYITYTSHKQDPEQFHHAINNNSNSNNNNGKHHVNPDTCSSTSSDGSEADYHDATSRPSNRVHHSTSHQSLRSHGSSNNASEQTHYYQQQQHQQQQSSYSESIPPGKQLVSSLHRTTKLLLSSLKQCVADIPELVVQCKQCVQLCIDVEREEREEQEEEALNGPNPERGLTSESPLSILNNNMKNNDKHPNSNNNPIKNKNNNNTEVYDDDDDDSSVSLSETHDNMVRVLHVLIASPNKIQSIQKNLVNLLEGTKARMMMVFEREKEEMDSRRQDDPHVVGQHTHYDQPDVYMRQDGYRLSRSDNTTDMKGDYRPEDDSHDYRNHSSSSRGRSSGHTTSDNTYNNNNFERTDSTSTSVSHRSRHNDMNTRSTHAYSQHQYYNYQDLDLKGHGLHDSGNAYRDSNTYRDSSSRHYTQGQSSQNHNDTNQYTYNDRGGLQSSSYHSASSAQSLFKTLASSVSSTLSTLSNKTQRITSFFATIKSPIARNICIFSDRLDAVRSRRARRLKQSEMAAVYVMDAHAVEIQRHMASYSHQHPHQHPSNQLQTNINCTSRSKGDEDIHHAVGVLNRGDREHERGHLSERTSTTRPKTAPQPSPSPSSSSSSSHSSTSSSPMASQSLSDRLTESQSQVLTKPTYASLTRDSSLDPQRSKGNQGQDERSHFATSMLLSKDHRYVGKLGSYSDKHRYRHSEHGGYQPSVRIATSIAHYLQRSQASPSFLTSSQSQGVKQGLTGPGSIPTQMSAIMAARGVLPLPPRESVLSSQVDINSLPMSPRVASVVSAKMPTQDTVHDHLADQQVIEPTCPKIVVPARHRAVTGRESNDDEDEDMLDMELPDDNTRQWLRDDAVVAGLPLQLKPQHQHINLDRF